MQNKFPMKNKLIKPPPEWSGFKTNSNMLITVDLPSSSINNEFNTETEIKESFEPK